MKKTVKEVLKRFGIVQLIGASVFGLTFLILLLTNVSFELGVLAVQVVIPYEVVVLFIFIILDQRKRNKIIEMDASLTDKVNRISKLTTISNKQEIKLVTQTTELEQLKKDLEDLTTEELKEINVGDNVTPISRYKSSKVFSIRIGEGGDLEYRLSKNGKWYQQDEIRKIK